MSSPSSSPRLSIYSPPFTPIRPSTRKGTTVSSPSDATPAMLLTPGATPLNGNSTNRFGVLASPSATRNPTRVPLKAKSQNLSSGNAEANWRVNRKRDTPKTPIRPNGNGQHRFCRVFRLCNLMLFSRPASDPVSLHATSQQGPPKPECQPCYDRKLCKFIHKPCSYVY